MNDLGVIDRFLAAFIRYIDSGFGLLGGDVAFLTSTLVAIDITLAGLFWAMAGDDDIIARLLRKILYVGAFALILGNFQRLSEIIFSSFAGLGLKAGGGAIGAETLLRPGQLAGTGFEAAWPLLDQASKLLGFTSFFDNFLTIAILLLAWLFVIVAFFILAVQLFVTILEFKLTTLAGFVLVPFALWNRTGFLAERVLGNVVTSGIKVMVLAVIVGIGSGFFGDFIGALDGQEPDIGQAMSLVLASLALLGLGIFGPSVASGLVAGAPQLGAGAAAGAAAAGVGTVAVGGAAAVGGARAAGGAILGGLRAGTAMGSAASTSYRLGQESSGSATVGAGLAGVGRAARSAAGERLRNMGGLAAASERGRRSALLAETKAAEGGGVPAVGTGSDPVPGWARKMHARQSAQNHRQLALHAIREGERGGAGATPDISEREEPPR
jgi:type IV secretion system protein TrbL